MASEARVDLEAFHRFLEDQLSNGGCSLSPEECLDLWRARHPLDGGNWDDLNAVNVALVDMEAGDSGEAFHQFSEEFCKKNRLPA